MVDDLTVLLVGDGDPDEKLIEQLEKKNLGVEISSRSEFSSLLALVEPHIVLHTGLEGAADTARILKEAEAVRRVRLIVRAERKDLPELRKLDKTVVVSVLATDIAPSVVAARVLMLAKKGPEKSLRPPKPDKKAPTPPKIQSAPEPPKIAVPRVEKDAAVTDRKPVVPKKPGDPSLGKPAAPKVEAKPPTVKKPAPPKATRSIPPKATPPQQSGFDDEDETVVMEPINMDMEEIPSSGPPSSEPPPSEFPTRAFEAPIPDAARPAAADVRIVLADKDVTRADIIACALRDQGIPTRIVPLDAAATHWPIVRSFAPTVLLGDGGKLKTEGAVWLQLFQADQELKKAKLVAVPFERIFKAEDASVNLRTLIPQIPQLSGVEVSRDPQPTAAMPKPDESPPPAAGQSAEAPAPFDDDDDDENEFERMTVARPVDEPLPDAARSSVGPRPPATSGPAPIPDSLRHVDLSAPETKREPAPTPLGASAAQQTPQPTTTPGVKEKSGGAGKLISAVTLILAIGAGGGWYVLNKNKAGNPATPAPAPAAEKPAPQEEPKPQQAPQKEEPVEQAPALDPEIARWKVSPKTPVPDCESLVPNLEELSAGGVQQATLSLNKARQAMVRGELDPALKLMCEAVLVHPGSMALEELASLYVTKQSPEQALKWQSKALEARPERPRTIELGGDIYNQLGRLDESRDAYVSSLKVDGSDTKTLHAVAKQFIEQGQTALRSGSFAKAQLLYRRAAVLNDKNPDATAGIAATNAAMDNKDGARAWAEKTLSMDDGHHIALVVMAAIATEAGETDRAKELCNKALERNANYPLAHQLLHQLNHK